MNECAFEPRTAIWAVAEVCWQDQTGIPNRAAATLEDTSPSGACIRVKTPIKVGSNLTIRWHREQFSGVARNCRSDGREFLLGIQRDTGSCLAKSSGAVESAIPATEASSMGGTASQLTAPIAVRSTAEIPQQRRGGVQENIARAAARSEHVEDNLTMARCKAEPSISPASVFEKDREVGARASAVTRPEIEASMTAHGKASQAQSSVKERNDMQSKGILPKFLRRQQESMPSPVAPAEAAANPEVHVAEGIGGRATEMLSYDDIYHAAGILNRILGTGSTRLSRCSTASASAICRRRCSARRC